ncbi:MAG: SDR family oxidoreductase [Candidatus Eremiobacteraeota bacterium]|nr:SDR family oxidoreductase [Candidatus Eremiobacteraeota bacterium]
MGMIENKICLVMGADCEIGAKVVKAAIAEGAVVSAVGLDMQKLKKLSDETRKKEGSIDNYGIDKWNNESVKEIFSEIIGKHKNIDILINISLHNSNIDMNEENIPEIPGGGNLMTILSCKNVIPYMKKQGGGSILNIAPAVGLREMSPGVIESSSPGQIFALTRVMSVEYAVYDIRVNAIALGIFKTDEYRKFRSRQDPGFEKKMLRHIPMNRPGRPEEAVGPAMFLSSDIASYITGIVMNVDGGYAGY